VINPFDLSVVDPTNQLPMKMLEESKQQLSEPGKTRDSSAVFISRLLTRPDMAKQHLPDFIEWSIETLKAEKTTTFLVSCAIAFPILSRNRKQEFCVPLSQFSRLESEMSY